MNPLFPPYHMLFPGLYLYPLPMVTLRGIMKPAVLPTHHVHCLSELLVLHPIPFPGLLSQTETPNIALFYF